MRFRTRGVLARFEPWAADKLAELLGLLGVWDEIAGDKGGLVGAIGGCGEFLSGMS